MDTYEQLREILDSHPATAPKSQRIIEILRLLFTPPEAALAVTMSFKPKSPEQISAASDISAEEAIVRLESMAQKGIIFARKKDGATMYGLVPVIPGLFEYPFMKGRTTPLQERLAGLWEKYHQEALGESFAGNPTPIMRVVAVDRSITVRDRVHPHDEVKRLIEQAGCIAVTNCACRESVSKCDKPRDVCLIFEGTAEFLVERGFARRISREEGIRVLDRAEEAGLVHTSNNSADRATVICNCCPCCCTVLRGRTQLHHPHAFSTSRFEARVRPDACTGCGICEEERCPVHAIAVRDGVAEVDAEECIGCGLCASGCPAGAIDMAQRESVPQVPATVQEMGLRVVQEKGRMERFMKIMQR
ncbi:MAG: 4Fe-4S binding protein [Spirochaetes bacterium]|nr:4Fe-4S binding protein [Spirochaetota bacterium]